jgi:arsenical pump membrane protein
MDPAHIATWAIAGLAALGVLVRPFRLPEATWAVTGAAALLLFGLVGLDDVSAGLRKSLDVCLFLAGMMLLSETARCAGVFEWLAAHAVAWSRSSPRRLFLLVYLVGVAVTVILSNDATAVVLTPAVYAAARRARVDPLPYLFICAFVANAASFVLPISNPANLVLFASEPPPAAAWLARFGVPSLLAVVATYAALRLVMAGHLEDDCARGEIASPLSRAGVAALVVIALAALILVSVSMAHGRLGPPACLLGVVAVVATWATASLRPWTVIRGVSWSILPLVGALFVLVEGLARTGLVGALGALIERAAAGSQDIAAAAAGVVVALTSNLTNNLPSGLLAGAVAAQAHPPAKVIDALLIGVDLGPNLSITGSLATVLWLAAIRREGQEVGFRRFLKVGVIVMPPALVLALAARLLVG